MVVIILDGCPFPSKLVANTDTLKVFEVWQGIEEFRPNTCLQVPELHEEAGMVVDPHTLSELSSA